MSVDVLFLPALLVWALILGAAVHKWITPDMERLLRESPELAELVVEHPFCSVCGKVMGVSTSISLTWQCTADRDHERFYPSRVAAFNPKSGRPK